MALKEVKVAVLMKVGIVIVYLVIYLRIIGERVVSHVLPFPRNRWRRSRDNVSTSSESSFVEEESFSAVQWIRPRARNLSEFGSEVEILDKNLEQKFRENPDELVLQYKNSNRCVSSSRSSSEFNEPRTDSWCELYKNKIMFNQVSETSSSILNGGLEESSSSGE